jgi:YrbI family 3-deoxy-D-manno-octulosonate 8-phosphate phosphatase
MTEGSAKDINATQQVVERAKKIKLILMDVDGTFTDGRMTYFPDSTGKMVEFKFFSSHDGLAAHFCNTVGIKTGFISGLQSPAVEERARILGMTYVKQGHLDKDKVWEEVLADAKLTNEQVAFIGDDLTDLSLILKAGLGSARRGGCISRGCGADFEKPGPLESHSRQVQGAWYQKLDRLLVWALVFTSDGL